MMDVALNKSLLSPEGGMKLEIDFSIRDGSFVTLYGKSGAGKTSVLRMLAGLMAPESGRVMVRGETWVDTAQGVLLKPQKRKVGFVFQDYALFPNMTVRENLVFALEKNQSSQIVEELMEVVELGELANRKPATLSGGQQQRVALARALVQRPFLLLLDEPLSALDHEMRLKLQQYLLRIHQEYKLTTILVSHDISEIMRLSDEILMLDKGGITAQGKPAEVFSHREVSGKFQFAGEVLSIQKQDVVYVVSILIGRDLVRVIADESEARELQPGDQVIVASKAFNPIIRKIV